MKATKILTVALFALSSAFIETHAELTWEGTTDLTSQSIQANWLVQMYKDTSNDTILNSVTFYAGTGEASGSGQSSDDELLGSFVTTTVDNGHGAISFGENFDPYSSIYGSYVYTVIYDAVNFAEATQTRVQDETVYEVAGGGMETYSVPGDPANNGWQNLVAVPEPTTIAFLGLGMLLFFVRKKKRA